MGGAVTRLGVFLWARDGMEAIPASPYNLGKTKRHHVRHVAVRGSEREQVDKRDLFIR